MSKLYRVLIGAQDGQVINQEMEARDDLLIEFAKAALIASLAPQSQVNEQAWQGIASDCFDLAEAMVREYERRVREESST